MRHLYGVLLAAGILYAASIVANPLPVTKSMGGASVHFKTAEEGVWPYLARTERKSYTNPETLTSLPGPAIGHWI